MREDKRTSSPIYTNQYERLRANVVYSAGWLRHQMAAVLTPFEVTVQQFNILRILQNQAPEGISTLQIRKRMLDKMSDTSRLVDRLQKKGLVDKVTAERDKRLVEVTITPSGLQLLEQIQTHISNPEVATLNLDEEEVEQLNALLDKMRDV